MKEIHRAYSIIETKQFDESGDVVTISGVATTPSPDRQGDIVDPTGAVFARSMPLLWQHHHEQPVGRIEASGVDKSKISFKAEIPIIREAGRLKDRVDEALHSVKYGLVSAVSIGFRVLGGEGSGWEYRDNSGGLIIKSWEWLELSLVTIPANSEAIISAVKSFDGGGLSAAVDMPETNKNQSGGTGAIKPVTLIPRVYENSAEIKSGTFKLLRD